MCSSEKPGWDGWEARQSLDWLGSARRVTQICDAVGIQVAAICGPNVTLDVTHPTHEINKRRIEFASDLEVPTFMTKGPGRLDSETTDLDLDRMAAVYDDLAAYGEPLGVTVTFHPHTGHVVDSADEWKRFMTRLHRCRLCLDMSHAVHWGYDPIQAVYDYRDRIAYVHLHDHKDGGNVELGEGLYVRLSRLSEGVRGCWLQRLDNCLSGSDGTYRRSEDPNQSRLPEKHRILMLGH